MMSADTLGDSNPVFFSRWLRGMDDTARLMACGLLCFGVSSLAQTVPTAPAQNVPSTASTRTCTANPILGGNAKANPAKKSKHPLPPEPLPACVEVKGEAIEV